ncbi:amidohydrolase family protein [Bradyrhizobium sp. CNPSo 4026]|nr:amidohydrolase family protein [Bradyrhizobium cenepequi]
MTDILIRNARLRGRGDALSDIAISDRVIVEIGPRLGSDARLLLDAGGNLVTPPYVNAHLHLLWMTKEQDIATLYDMITSRPAAAINLAKCGIEAGYPANLVVLDQPDVTNVLRFHAPPAAVISHGRMIDLAHMSDLAQISRR